MSVYILPSLGVYETDLIWGYTNDIAILLVEFVDVLVDRASPNSLNLGNTSEGDMFGAWESAEWVKIDSVDPADYPSHEYLSDGKSRAMQD